MNRKSDPQDRDYSYLRTTCTDHENRIKDVEDKVTTIDTRQEKIYKSMYGPNGDQKEGYVWKMEQVLLWLYGDPKKGMCGLMQEWQAIKKEALRGAKAAIWLLICGAGYVIWQILKHMLASGWRP